MTENNIISLNFSENDYVVPVPLEKIQKESSDMVPFGDDNMFPQQLLALTERTPLVSSIIDKITKYVYGEGVNDEYKDMIVDDKGTTFPDLVYGAINDYITFGAIALQVRRNVYGDIKKIDRLRVERIRTNEDNDTLWYHKSWQKYAKPNLVYEAFKGEGARKQSDSILYYKNPSSRHIYGFAAYWSSLDSVSTMQALGEYGLSAVNNCFTPSAIITLCEGKPGPDEVKQVEKNLNEKFCGVKNTAKLLVAFADSKETAPEITPFQSADLNAHFLTLKEMTENNIYAAFSIDPLLVGVRNSDGVFASSAYQEAFDLFNRTEIVPIQQQIIKCFNKLGYDIEFKPFKIDWSTNQTENETNVNEVVQ